MRHYTQLTREQRYQIQECRRGGFKFKLSTIAARVGVSISTISRELKRNSTNKGSYRAESANNKALLRRKSKAKRQIDPTRWETIETLIRKDWSPEQISLWLKKTKQPGVSHERIYQYIIENKKAGGDLYKHLRGSKKRRKRYGTYNKRNTIIDRVSIDERPSAINDRKRFGHWEVDLVMGKQHKSPMVTLVERKTRFSLMDTVNTKSADEVADKVIELLQPFKRFVHSITSDNGKEFAYHKKISQALSTKFYFAHPYHSWQRGTNENTNGLIRQYFPRTMDFRLIDDDALDHAMNRLNHRPRKCLNMETPFDMFFKHIQRFALNN